MKIKEILEYLDSIGIAYTFNGNDCDVVSGFSSLSNYKESSFTWIKTSKNIPESFDLAQVKLAIVSNEIPELAINYIKTNESKRAFFSVIENFYERKVDRPKIGQNTYISKDVKLGENVIIGHNCVLDGNITIADHTIIWNNVTIINKVIIGKNTEVQSGTIIGHDDFAWAEDEVGNKTMIKHYGGVEIGCDVYLGCNVIINRGTIDNTTIGSKCKIDMSNSISHNVIINENVSLVSGNNIYGSVNIGANTYIAGSCTVRNQIKIGSNAFIGMGAVVLKDVEANTTVVGNPAKPFIKKK